MRLAIGEKAPPVRLDGIDGKIFDSADLNGRRYLLSFFRFASCPFCNLRVHQLVSRHSELGAGFAVVAIFDSSHDNLRRRAEKHEAPFPILADPKRTYYQAYGIEKSLVGVFAGMFKRMPALLRAMFVKGYWPTSPNGSLTSMPADFLIDETGIIRVAYYGRDEGDHLPFDRIKEFARENAGRSHGKSL
jgi:peroxiredoxin